MFYLQLEGNPRYRTLTARCAMSLSEARGNTGHVQRGYEASGWSYVGHNVTEIVNGESKRVQRSHRTVAKRSRCYLPYLLGGALRLKTQ
jgi:hypothetical protein